LLIHRLPFLKNTECQESRLSVRGDVRGARSQYKKSQLVSLNQGSVRWAFFFGEVKRPHICIEKRTAASRDPIVRSSRVGMTVARVAGGMAI
jgi:hypothetical protein